MSKVYTDSIEKRTGGAAITVPASGQWIDLASAAQGDVLYHNGTSYVRLAPGTSGQHLQTAGAAANPTWATVVPGGTTDCSMWRLTTTFTGDASPIASNLEEDDGPDYVRLGSAMTESSGVFTFPSTGFWMVEFYAIIQRNSGTQHCDITIESLISSVSDTRAKASIGFTNENYTSGSCATLFDCSNTSTHKVQFAVSQTNTANGCKGDTNNNVTYFIFTRLADT